MGEPTDRVLVLGAQGGDVASLGALLERHEARLLGLAMRWLGDASAAHDAVQETALVALRRVGDLRDAEAAGAWLGSILLNVCRMARRSAPPPPEWLDETAFAALGVLSPEEEVERLATSDWVWTALLELPEPLRETVVLRYFGTWSSYAEIATILGVPVGTVRSRLSLARGRLAAALLATADDVHDEERDHRRAQELEFRAAAAELNAGTGCRGLTDIYEHDVRARFASGAVEQGRRLVQTSLEGDLAAGMRMRLDRVLVSGAITVVEARLEGPPDDPFRCPPATCQVHLRPQGGTSDVRLFFSPRMSADAPASPSA